MYMNAQYYSLGHVWLAIRMANPYINVWAVHTIPCMAYPYISVHNILCCIFLRHLLFSCMDIPYKIVQILYFFAQNVL